MPMTNLKRLMLSLLLLTFIGQGVASTLNHCLSAQQTSGPDMHGQMSDMTDSDHAQHMPDLSDMNMDMQNCEMQSCECELGGCSFATLPTSDTPVALISHSMDNHFQNSYTGQPLNSLFRPPITR